MASKRDAGLWSGAQWIWHPPVERMYSFHMLARRVFAVEGDVTQATCMISANTSYELYVNGRWIGRGPERSYPEWQYYDAYDLTETLGAGDNVIAVQAYNHGVEHPGILRQTLGRGGLIARLSIQFAGGEELVVGSDGAWSVLRAPQYGLDAGFVTVHRQDYKEVYDASGEPLGWRDVDFDDAAWLSPEVLGPVGTAPWTHLSPRDIPHFTSDPVYPVNVFGHLSGCAYGFSEHDITNPLALASDDDQVAQILPLNDDFSVQLLLDFGRPVAGRFHLDVADCRGGRIEVSYGDDLDLTRIDQLLLRPGAQHYQPYERRFGRYVMLTCRDLPAPLKLRRAWFEMTTYPVEDKGAFSCSDETLNRIWDVGRWTLRMDMHDVFEDCPFREQTLYCGDVRVSGLLAYYAFGDYQLARRCLVALARIQGADGSIPNCGLSPRGDAHIPEYPALWLIGLADYWRHSGDISLVRELWGTVQRLIDWYRSWHDERGLMRQLPSERRNDFVDNLAGIDQAGQVLAVQCLYHYALVGAAEMARAQGEDHFAEHLVSDATSIAEAVNELYWSPELHGYIDSIGEDGEPIQRTTPDIEGERDATKPLNQITNGLMLFSDLVPEDRKHGTLEVLLNPGLAPPVRAGYMNFHLAEALFDHGRPVDAIQRIRDYWGEMIRRGATTFWEVFDPQTPPGRLPDRLWSLCHAFCAGPVYSLPAHVLGVQPLEAGFSRARIQPQHADLRWARGTVPTPLGPIDVNWRRGDDGLRFELEVGWPAGMAVELSAPVFHRSTPAVIVDGETVIDGHRSADDATVPGRSDGAVEFRGSRAIINRSALDQPQRCLIVTC